MTSSTNYTGWIPGSNNGTYMNLYADDNDINNGIGFEIPRPESNPGYSLGNQTFRFFLFPGETYRIIMDVQYMSVFNFTNTNTWSIPSSVLTNVQFHHKGPTSTLFSATTIIPDNSGSTAASRLTINFWNPTTSNGYWSETN